MAATYGYGGEFSSDEDIDRTEQQSAAKFGAGGAQAKSAKPTKQQIEEVIQSILELPFEQEIILSDEHIVGLLDYYKIQRGPVVDSTRKLYMRIALKQVREVASNGQLANNNSTTTTTNGNSDNNNSINIISKRLQSAAQVEPASSDDDEPMPPVSSQSSVEQTTTTNRRKFDSRVAYANDKPEPMEVDIVAPITPLVGDIRTTKQVDISSSESEAESDEGSSSGKSSDSEELDITPLKQPPKQLQVGRQASGKIIASTPIKDSATKISPVTPKESTKIKSKTPQTTKRSQRIATRSSSGVSKTTTDVSSSKTDDSKPIAQATTLNKSTLASFENCSRAISKIKLEPPLSLSIVEDENGEIVFGSTINGRKLNYAEKMVLMSLTKRDKRHKEPIKPSST